MVKNINKQHEPEIISHILDYRGYWTSMDEINTHSFDKPLCDAIIKMCKDEKCPWIKRLKTIIDIGCGDGSYTTHFNNNGFKCVGYDGNLLTPEISVDSCYVKDFSDPVDVGKYDLVLCLEVGEHIPVEYEQTFLDNICRAAKNDIILSWAIIGQKGNGHVNCRNNDYIINEMLTRKFNLDTDRSNFLRKQATLDWFGATIMYFQK